MASESERLHAVGYLLGCRRESNGFKSFEKENLLWGCRTQFAKRGLHTDRNLCSISWPLPWSFFLIFVWLLSHCHGNKKKISSQVWRFLLGYHAYESTFAEREYLMSVKKSEYEVIKKQWQVCPLDLLSCDITKLIHFYSDYANGNYICNGSFQICSY